MIRPLACTDAQTEKARSLKTGCCLRGARVGAVYEGGMHFPVIGQQSFKLTIISESMARIRLHGALALEEPTAYFVDANGSMGFELNEATHQLLQRVRTKIVSAEYHEDDTADILVAPPVFPAMRVRLTRVGEDPADPHHQPVLRLRTPRRLKAR